MLRLWILQQGRGGLSKIGEIDDGVLECGRIRCQDRGRFRDGTSGENGFGSVKCIGDGKGV